MLAAMAMLGAGIEAKADIVIAVAGPQSGPQSGPQLGAMQPRAVAIAAGASRAAAKINARGGVLGEKISVIVEDDGCDAARAAKTASDLAGRKVNLVLGHPCVAAALAAAKVYGEKSTVFIATSTRAAQLTKPRAGATIFRLAGRDSQQSEDAARYLAATFTGKSIAVVHDRTRYARTIAESVESALKKGGNPVIDATLIAGEKDYPLVTAKIKDAAAIFFAGYPIEAGLLHAQLRAARGKGPMLLSDSNATAELIDTFGAAWKSGEVRVMLPRYGLGPATGALLPGERDDVEADLAGVAVEVYAAAAIAAQSSDPAKVATVLNSAAIIGDTTVSFEASGDARRPSFDVFAWSGATWTLAP